MTDLYHHIHDGEIFQKSRCIWHENAMMDFFRSQLQMLGYHSTSASNKVWARGSRQVVVCLADDVYTCRPQGHLGPMPTTWDINTTVITDNYITCATQYQVCRLPDSYFGIYHYQPQLKDWQPSRRFNFAVNRLDAKRLILFLELVSRATKPDPNNKDWPLLLDLDRDWVNFNCWSWNSTNDSPQVLQQNFLREYQNLPLSLRRLYDKTFKEMSELMPYRNHDLSLEQCHVQAWLNMIIETYSSDTNIALSEKTFRALVTPVPFVLYAGKYTTARLCQMGFDIMGDLVQHRTDFAQEKHTGQFGDRLVDFIKDADQSVDSIKKQDFVTAKTRCQQAAEHNQNVLAQMAQQWPADFAEWWSAVLKKIS
jgi:hypothetical protein